VALELQIPYFKNIEIIAVTLLPLPGN